MTSADEPGSHNAVTDSHVGQLVQAGHIHGDVILVNNARRALSEEQRLIAVGVIIAVLGSGTWYLVGSGPSAPPVLHSGHVVLAPDQGLDLDAGRITDQNVVGVDISPGREADVVNVMTRGRLGFAALAGPGPFDVNAYAACTDVAPDWWDPDIHNVHRMRVGKRLCVYTSDGNLGILRLTQVPSNVSPRLEFDYTTWQGR